MKPWASVLAAVALVGVSLFTTGAAHAVATTTVGNGRAGLVSTTPIQGSQIAMCRTNYPTMPTVVHHCKPVKPGGGINAAGSDSVGVHWAGTDGSYAHFPCAVPSIVTGIEYATYTSSELDVTTTSQDDHNTIQEWCQVQTPDRPAANLLATLHGKCFNQSQNPSYRSKTKGNTFTVTEDPAGLVTLRCTFDTRVKK